MPEERVLCLTTIDKEVCDRISQLVMRTRQTIAMLPHTSLDKLQALNFIMLKQNDQPQYDVQIKDKTDKTQRQLPK